MKKLLVYTLLSIATLFLTAQASRVTNVSLTYQPQAVIARISVDGAVRFSHQTEVPKNGRPDRLIVDVLSATHHLGRKTFDQVNIGPITAIRTSQFSVKPEQIVRVVFDLKSAPVYQIRSEGHDIIVTLSAKNVKPFAAWSTKDVVARQHHTKPVTVASKPKATPAAAKHAVDARAANKKIDADRMLSIAPNPKPTAKSAPKPVEKVTRKTTPRENHSPMVNPSVQTKKTLARYQTSAKMPAATKPDIKPKAPEKKARPVM
ncbi:MAG: AMIN domain-containing protein, partial [Candidatus Zixiibacteriota bacterium]